MLPVLYLPYISPISPPRLHRCYLCSRVIQGRLNDVGMLCGSHAARTADGLIEPEAAALLTQVLYLPYISPISPLYLPYISPISPLYLPYISSRRCSCCPDPDPDPDPEPWPWPWH